MFLLFPSFFVQFCHKNIIIKINQAKKLNSTPLENKLKLPNVEFGLGKVASTSFVLKLLTSLVALFKK